MQGFLFLKTYIEERVIDIANYIIDNNTTVRKAAKQFGVSKSTAHKDVTTRLLEINPRIDATVSIFAAGGLNLPYLQIKHLLGETLPDINVQYGTRLKRRYSEMFTTKNGKFLSW